LDLLIGADLAERIEYELHISQLTTSLSKRAQCVPKDDPGENRRDLEC